MSNKFTDDNYNELYVKYTNLLYMYSKAMFEVDQSRLFVQSIKEVLEKYERAVG